MIKEKELSAYRKPVCYENGSQLSLDGIQNAFLNAANELQISLKISKNQIKSGGMLSSNVQDCLVLYHPNHQKDYYNFVVSIRRQGAMAFVSVDTYGSSKNSMRLEHSGQAGKDLKMSIFSKDPNESAKALGRAIAGGIMGLGGSKNKKREEENWYSYIATIIQKVIN